MKILLQGGYRKKRDPEDNQALVRSYYEELARRLPETDHQLVLSSYARDDKWIADRLHSTLGADSSTLKQNLLFYLPERSQDSPDFGMVRRFESPKYWSDERTALLLYCDLVLAIGGGRGTVDCIQKAFLSKKPVFVAHQIPGYPREVWNRMAQDYCYQEPGDADFITDENSNPAEFFDHTFAILDRLTIQEADNSSTGRDPALPTRRLKQLVADGNLEEAVDQLTALADHIDRGLHNQIIVLSGQLKRIRRDQHLGIADKSEEEARIMMAFLRVLDDLVDMGG